MAALDAILPEAFAVVREAGIRAVQMRHFDVQLIDGMVLHSGQIAEMRTGEGKTLVATLPAISTRSKVTASTSSPSTYLAKRDAEWMGKIYGFLGLSAGVIVNGLSDEQRRETYRSDITYGPNEFGFDYLRDNTKIAARTCVQRDRTSPSSTKSTPSSSTRLARRSSSPARPTRPPTNTLIYIIPDLEAGEVIETMETKTAPATTSWTRSARHHRHRRGLGEDRKAARHRQHRRPRELGPQAPRRGGHQGAHLYKRDVDYVVKDGEVIIVDEFTGRLMPGRRWSDGLHQAIEAKEGVAIARKTRPWPPSPSRTTSGCTRNSPA